MICNVTFSCVHLKTYTLHIQVNFGIIDANPSNLAGVMEIMSTLQNYVPCDIYGKYRTVPTHGDALSVERMVDSQRALAADLSSKDRLDGLLAVPQEFHHRGLMLQVVYI